MKANFCEQCVNYDKINMLDGYCKLYRISVSYDHTCLNFDNKSKNISMCENCYYFGEIPDDKICGYCMKDALLTCKTDICPFYREKEKGKNMSVENGVKVTLERNVNTVNEEKTLLCDNCRFAEFKDNNDSFYCALYDQPIYADPHHLVCDHHSDHYKGFDSPRYVR